MKLLYKFDETSKDDTLGNVLFLRDTPFEDKIHVVSIPFQVKKKCSFIITLSQDINESANSGN